MLRGLAVLYLARADANDVTMGMLARPRADSWRCFNHRSSSSIRKLTRVQVFWPPLKLLRPVAETRPMKAVVRSAEDEVGWNGRQDGMGMGWVGALRSRRFRRTTLVASHHTGHGKDVEKGAVNHHLRQQQQ